MSHLKFYYLFCITLVIISCVNENDNPLSTRDDNENDLSTSVAMDPVKDIITTVEFKNPIRDFGKVTNDTTIREKYYFVNTGSNTLNIDFVNPDCSCTGYSVSSNSLLPGEEGFIELELNTEDKAGKQKIYTVVKLNSKQRFHKLL